MNSVRTALALVGVAGAQAGLVVGTAALGRMWGARPLNIVFPVLVVIAGVAYCRVLGKLIQSRVLRIAVATGGTILSTIIALIALVNTFGE